MKTLTLHATISAEGIIDLHVPSNLPAGPAEVVVVIQPLGQAPAKSHDEWERRLLQAATDCGVSLPHSALSSEGLYE